MARNSGGQRPRGRRAALSDQKMEALKRYPYGENREKALQIFASSELQRVAAASTATTGSLARVCSLLLTSAELVERGLNTQEEMRASEEDEAKFNADLVATIRFLTRHVDAGANADDVPDATVRQLIDELKRTYEYDYAANRVPYDRLAGQKHNHRAYLIRKLAECVPSETTNRAAAIAGLLKFGGYPNVDRRLVTSILKESDRR
jgi:hypothetical protein